MKFFTSLLLGLFITTRLFSQCANSNNVYTFIYNNTKYEVIKELKTWTNAAACAVERGGHLVEINDANEQSAVFDAIINGAQVSTTYTAVPNGGNIAYVWIGATDQNEEGTWIWDGNNDNTGTHFWSGQGANGANNGSSVEGAYYNWGGKSTGTPKEPDNWNSDQNHAAIGLTGWPSGTENLGIAGEWNDIIGSSELFFVIEYEEGTSINENKLNGKGYYNVYPNPSEGKINIDGNYKYVEVFDISGRFLHKFKHEDAIDISNFGNNFLLVRIVGDLFVQTEKVVLK